MSRESQSLELPLHRLPSGHLALDIAEADKEDFLMVRQSVVARMMSLRLNQEKCSTQKRSFYHEPPNSKHGVMIQELASVDEKRVELFRP